MLGTDVLNLDRNVESAVENYFLYGLDPGSFTTSLIRGDYSQAIDYARRLLDMDPLDEPAHRQLPGCLGDSQADRDDTLEERWSRHSAPPSLVHLSVVSALCVMALHHRCCMLHATSAMCGT